MAGCVYCGAETKLYYADVPICLDCSDMIDKGETPPRKQPAGEKKNGNGSAAAA